MRGDFSFFIVVFVSLILVELLIRISTYLDRSGVNTCMIVVLVCVVFHSIIYSVLIYTLIYFILVI
jgi:hypothetical protein